MRTQLTIVIPCLNEEQCLPHLIGDLVNQRVKDFKVIVVDGGSRDRTVSVAQEVGNKLGVRVVRAPVANVAAQRNLGAVKARTEWLMCVDADVRLDREFVGQVLTEIERQKVECLTTWVRPDEAKVSNFVVAGLVNVGLSMMARTRWPECFGSMVIVKKLTLLDCGGFRDDVCFREDTEMVRRLVARGYRFRVLWRPVMTMSFRRCRVVGTWAFVSLWIRSYLNEVGSGFAKKPLPGYPMLGGSYYREEVRD